jgi:hypothetical protein
VSMALAQLTGYRLLVRPADYRPRPDSTAYVQYVRAMHRRPQLGHDRPAHRARVVRVSRHGRPAWPRALCLPTTTASAASTGLR